MKKIIQLFMLVFSASSITHAQNVGIGNTDPFYKLDISGRMRIRGGTDLFNSAGIYLSGTGSESLTVKSLMGMASDTSVGFYGYDGSGWGFTMDIRNGNIGVGEGTPHNRSGFTVNNRVGNVNAMFGSNTSGVAIESDFPGIGFNTYYNGGRKAIANGYGGYIGINPFGGGMSIGVSSSSANAGSPITVNTAIYIKPDGNVGLSNTSPNAPLQFSNSVQNRKLVLYETFNNDHQFYGLGINSSTLRYQVAGTGDSHVFYAGTQSDASAELFRIQGNGNIGAGVSDPAFRLDVGARMRIRSAAGSSAGLWLNNAANSSSPAFIGMQSDNQVGFYGNNGAGWGFLMNTQNGSLNINGSQGQTGQVLMSNGSSGGAAWTWPGSFITTGQSGLSIFNDLTGSGPHDFTNSTFSINLATQARVMLFYKTTTLKLCLAGNCTSKWRLEAYNNGSVIDVFFIDGNSYGLAAQSEYKTTSTTNGPTFLTLPAGSYTFSFAGTSFFNEPTTSLQVSYIIINL